MPLSYPAYKVFFEKRIVYVNNPKKSDVVILSFFKDIIQNFDVLVDALTYNPRLKLVLLSEEPFWDSIMNNGFVNYIDVVSLNGVFFEIYNLNHVTTKIYDFRFIPYFVTTDDRFFSRYACFFKRNSVLKKEEVLSRWSVQPYKYSFLAEKREGDVYNAVFPSVNVRGLCEFRTKLAFKSLAYKSSVSGFGWDGREKRQTLADWHLDKLTSLDSQTFMMSALENTHHNHYLTEKLFDAFSIGAIPFGYYSDDHKIHQLVEPESFINLYGLDVDEAWLTLEQFEVDENYVEGYLKSQKRLAALFCDVSNLSLERLRTVAQVVNELEAIV